MVYTNCALSSACSLAFLAFRSAAASSVTAGTADPSSEGMADKLGYGEEAGVVEIEAFVNDDEEDEAEDGEEERPCPSEVKDVGDGEGKGEGKGEGEENGAGEATGLGDGLEHGEA